MALELLDLHHRFGRRVALDGVSLRVERGDCYGFLGHNGAGKTTAMRIALGLLRPQRGMVRVDGHIDAMQQRARTRGLIEHPGFFRELSGLENLRRLARLDGLSPRDAAREAARVLDLVGLTPHGDARAGAYSQGMRQRLGVAQALLGDPAYVLLDEPTNGLDPEGIAELRQMLGTLTDAVGCTVLLSSHQLHELEGLCNRVGILRQGRLVLEGDTAELLRDARGRTRVALDEAPRAVPLWQKLGLDPRDVEGQLEVDLGEHPPAEVLAALVASGARPTVFAPERPTLEALYLRVAGGEIAAPSKVTNTQPAPVVAPLALPRPMDDLRARRPLRGRAVGALADAPAPRAAHAAHGHAGVHAAGGGGARPRARARPRAFQCHRQQWLRRRRARPAGGDAAARVPGAGARQPVDRR
ncbi:MAG: ABC transporter ATP-binding protein [Phycisphaerales bacterium]|nr:ABC transporter ATP-binding protein [Phycisphaerales bacterium]